MICSQPITVKAAKINKIYTENRTYAVPCGVCSVCKQNRVQEWVYRLKQQQKESFSTDFVTFTYSEENMPMVWSDYLNTSVGTLNPEDLEKFWKRLRKSYGSSYEWVEQDKENKPPIRLKNTSIVKYYACGEYGEHTWRPHYHAIIFNLPTDEIEKRDLLWKAWGLGAIDISTEEVGPNALAYTAKYIDKVDNMHSDDVRIKKFSRMSQGLGEGYLDKQTVKWHRQNIIDRNYVSLDHTGGSKQKMPRYYRKKIYTKAQRNMQAIQIQQEKLRKEGLLSQPFKVEYERKLHSEKTFNSHLNRRKRDIQNLDT